MTGRVLPFPGRPEPWVTKAHLAAYLGRSNRWVELKVCDGVPSHMIGGRRAFRISEVDQWLRERFG